MERLNPTQLVEHAPVTFQSAILALPYKSSPTFAELIPKFTDHIIYEETLSRNTAKKHADSLQWVLRYLPHIVSPEQLTLDDITTIKKKMEERGVGASRVNSIVFALRKFLTYCQERHCLTTINPKDIKPKRMKKTQVTFLTEDEIRQLLNSINTDDRRGLRMRTLMEVLIATGMRIAECLSLNKNTIDWEKKEAMIIGKGSKERLICFTDRAIEWMKKYIASRSDDNQALFIAFGSNNRMTQYDLSKLFKHYTQLAGIKKRVTPHMLRHTMATLLLRRGCNIKYIQELLGHSDIETTARYYLGTDKTVIKEAHAKYLNFD